MTKTPTKNYKKTTIDGFINVLTGYNTARDRNSHFSIVADPQLDEIEIDNLYRSSKLAKKYCSKPAEEMTKEEIIIYDDQAEDIHRRIKELKCYNKIKEALITKNRTGGSVIVLDIQDGQDIDKEVNVNKIVSVNLGPVLSKKYVIPDGIYDGLTEPEFYLINNIKIHHSRILKFSNTNTTENERKENNSFSDSSLRSIKEEIQNLTVTVNNIAKIDLDQVVYKFAELNSNLGTDETEEQIIKKLLMIDMSRGIIRGIALDKEDDFIRNTANLTGLSDYIKIFREALTSATDIPHNILLGESPGSSLGEAGQGQMIAWYDYIKSLQQDELTTIWGKLLLYISHELNIDRPILWTFKGLWQMDDKEKSEIEYKRAETFNKIIVAIKALWEMGSLSSDEIRNLISNSKDFNALSEKINELLEKAVFQDA